MDTQDRQAIEDLFGRLDEADRQGPPKDAEAEALIRDKIAGQPGAPYLMAQTIVMQDYALNQAQQRIEELERQAAERPAGGGFLSGLFGGGSPAPRAQNAMGAPAGSAAHRPMGAPMLGAAAGQQSPLAQQPGRGGFLAGAAQTAMGVAGGVLLANAVGSMFGGDDAAKTAEAAQPAGQDTQTASAEEDEGGLLDSFFGDDDGETA